MDILGLLLDLLTAVAAGQGGDANPVSAPLRNTPPFLMPLVAYAVTGINTVGLFFG